MSYTSDSNDMFITIFCRRVRTSQFTSIDWSASASVNAPKMFEMFAFEASICSSMSACGTGENGKSGAGITMGRCVAGSYWLKPNRSTLF